MGIKVLVVDDDANMRLILKKTLQGIPRVEVVGEAVNGKEAIDLTSSLEPDVILMDVDMPERDGVEASKEIVDILPDVFLVYATGYPEYMKEAFEVYAFDYLLKPYNKERLIQTMTKIQQLVELREKNTSKSRELCVLGTGSIHNKLAVRIERKLALLDTDKITYISREKRKTIIHTDIGKKIVISETLDALEKRVTDRSFIRTHRSYLVNLDKVVQIEPWSRNNYMLVFGSLKEVAYITEERYRELREKLNVT